MERLGRCSGSVEGYGPVQRTGVHAPLGGGRHDSVLGMRGLKSHFWEIWAEQHPRVGVAWDTVPTIL